MYISPNLIFIELPKTGSTCIDQVLLDLGRGRKEGKHNYPSKALLQSGTPFVASIRHPLDWYVSLWSYGCKARRRSGLFRKTTQWRPFELAGYGLKSNPWQGILGYAKYISSGLIEDRQRWLDCYEDHREPELFQRWLTLLFDRKRTYAYNSIYDRTALNDVVGYYTFRYLWMTTTNREELYRQKNIDDSRALAEWEHVNSFISYFVRLESLVSDLTAVLEACGFALTAQELKRIEATKRRNASDRVRDWRFYYDQHSIDMIYEKDFLLFNKFGYATANSR